ncbi:MAG: ABC transporter ATP-binding protein [Candidatus Zixiibacteriota bacterium]
MKIKKQTIIRLWGYLKPHWHLELLTLIDMGVIAALILAMPLAVKYLIDDLIPSLTAQAQNGIDVMPVVYFGLVLLGIYLFNVIFSYIRDYLVGYIGANIIASMRSQLFGHLEMLTLDFHQSHQVGEMMSRLLSDIQLIQYLLTSTLLVFLTNIMMLIAISIYLMMTDWILTLIALIPVPLTILLAMKYGAKIHLIAKNVQETAAALSAKLQESLLSIKTVKAFSQEEGEKKKVDGILGKLTGLYIKHSVTNSLTVNLVNLVNMAGPIVVLSWGTYMIAGGTMKLGALIAFYMLLSYLYSPIQSIASIHVQVQSNMASVNRFFEYLDISPAVTEPAHPIKLERARGHIKLDNVSFGYNSGGLVFDKLCLDIREGEKVAIVGPSGSGKTTLVNLLLRFFEFRSGSISIDEIDIRQISLKSLRGNIGLVDQDPLLFKTSIFNNIAYSNPWAAQDDIIRAAKIANIHDFIMSLPEQYQTEVGERGVTISGGEKQRICLARAILKNPPIIFLDEATSALDSRSEHLIQESLKEILGDKTAIIIAHRLSTIQHADRIIALDKGRIVDEGRHDELMQSSPLYRELAKHQLKM